jgi:hypothetical protein
VQAAGANVAITDRRYPIHHKPRGAPFMSIARTLAATLAVTALAVPAAQARPADIHAYMHASAPQTQKAQQYRDLRMPDTIDAADAINAAKLRGHGAAAVNAPGATAVGSASRPAPRTMAGPPTWPVNPQPITAAHAAKAVNDGGVDRTPIVLGIVGGLLAVCGIVVLTTRRRTQRLRLAS